MRPIESLQKLISLKEEGLQLIEDKFRKAIGPFVSSIFVFLLFSDKIPFNEWYVYQTYIGIIIIARCIVLDLINPGISKYLLQNGFKSGDPGFC